MDPTEAAEVAAALEAQRDDLVGILAQLVESRDAAANQHRFDRWKARVLAMIAERVNAEEAQRFEKTYVPLNWAEGEYNALAEKIQRHEASLRILIEEIREHPEGVLVNGQSESSTRKALAEAEAEHHVVVTPDPRKVFVIHGRDEEARTALFDLLRDLDLHPIQWEELVSQTGKGSPYNGEVVARAFREARAVLVLMTPDDEARLHPDLRGPLEPTYELELTGQARPNVILEAGMALQAHPDQTIFVEIGTLRPASDLQGLNALRVGGGEGALLALAMRLETAGCAVNRSNPAWMRTERFRILSAATRQPRETPRESPQDLPRGTRLPTAEPVPAPAALSARLYSRGKDYLLEIVNRGGITLRNIRWEFPPEVDNWHVLTQVLPKYPIPELEPREHIRVPVVLTMGSPAMVDITLVAEADHDPYSTKAKLSIYD